MYIIGVAIIYFSVLMAFTLKGIPLSMMFNMPAVTLILFTIVGVVVATSNFKTFIRGCNAILSPKYVISQEEREKAAGLFRLLSKAVLLMTLLCIFTGAVAALSNIDNVERMAYAVAAALIGPILGLLMSVAVFETGANRLRGLR